MVSARGEGGRHQKRTGEAGQCGHVRERERERESDSVCVYGIGVCRGHAAALRTYTFFIYLLELAGTRTG